MHTTDDLKAANRELDRLRSGIVFDGLDPQVAVAHYLTMPGATYQGAQILAETPATVTITLDKPISPWGVTPVENMGIQIDSFEQGLRYIQLNLIGGFKCGGMLEGKFSPGYVVRRFGDQCCLKQINHRGQEGSGFYESFEGILKWIVRVHDEYFNSNLSKHIARTNPELAAKLDRNRKPIYVVE